MITDSGAKQLVAAILKQAYQDYKKTDSCPEWCALKDSCENKNVDQNYCDAKKFIHGDWSKILCDTIEVDYSLYVLRSMQKCKLSRNTCKYVEGELRLYKQSIKRLDRMKDELILKAPKEEEIRGTDVGDPTANKVEAILKSKEIQHLEKITNAIKKIYLNCDPDKKRIIEEKYWNNKLTDAGISGKLGIGERTVRKYRNSIVYAIAVELNYL